MTQLIRKGKVRATIIKVTTTGGAGVSAGNTTSEQIVGQILGIEINYHASAPGTTDITIEGATTGLDLYAKANSATDAFAVPGVFGLSAAASALSGDVTPQKYCVAEPIKVTLAQCDDLTDAVTVRIIWRPVRCELIQVTTTGVSGSATGTTTSKPIVGEVLGLAIDYHASAPGATTDITIEGATSGLDLYAKSDSVTDAFVVPVLYSLDAGGSALTSDVTPRRYCIGEGVKVTVAQSDALTDCAVVRVFYDPDVVAETISVTTTGSAGSATGNTTGVQTHGEILGLAVNYHADAPAGTTDILVELADSGIDIYAKTNSVTDAYVAPGLFALSAAASALASNVTPERYVFGGKVKVTLSQSDALTDAVKVTVFSRR